MTTNFTLQTIVNKKARIPKAGARLWRVPIKNNTRHRHVLTMTNHEVIQYQ